MIQAFVDVGDFVVYLATFGRLNDMGDFAQELGCEMYDGIRRLLLVGRTEPQGNDWTGGERLIRK